jgi:two-component system, NarL family, response regulator NreC
VLESLSKLLEPHFTIVGRVQDSGDVISRALEYRPDVILLDACMPGLSGFAATRELKKILPRVKVILVTMLGEVHFHQRGVSGRSERLRVKTVGL